VSRLPARPALVGVAALAGMAGTGSLGWHLGRQAVVPIVEQPTLAAAMPSSDDRLAVLAGERDAALASVDRLQDRLSEAERRRADDAAELALYRRLGDRATGSGLGVDTVRWRSDGERDVLEVTLVQAKGRERVQGTLGVSLSGETGEAGRVELVPDSGAQALRFDLRFFEVLTVPIDPRLVAELEPVERLSISVMPSGERHPAFIDIRDWDTIIPGTSRQ